MKYLFWVAIIFTALVLQGSLSFFNVIPDLTIILACYAGIKNGEIKGLLLGSLIGMIEDSLSGGFLGPNFLSKGIAGYFSSLLYSKFFIWSPGLGMASFAIFTFADGFVVFLLRSLFDMMPVSPGPAFFVFTMQSLLNAPFGALLKPTNKE